MRAHVSRLSKKLSGSITPNDKSHQQGAARPYLYALISAIIVEFKRIIKQRPCKQPTGIYQTVILLVLVRLTLGISISTTGDSSGKDKQKLGSIARQQKEE